MGRRSEIFHDLNNAYDMLKIHLETLLAERGNAETHAGKSTHATAVRVTIERMDDLIKQYIEASSASESSRGLQTLALSDWKLHLREKILPTLAAIYRVRIQLEIGSISNHCRIVLNADDFRTICENLTANAAFAGATFIRVELKERSHSIDLIVRDNGCGMTEDQLQGLGLGLSTRGEEGHGRGFRIVCFLAAKSGALVRPPRSIAGVGTEITISFMKVGAALT